MVAEPGLNVIWHSSGEKVLVVFATIKIFPFPKQRPQVVEILRSVQDLTRPIPGCLGCHLAEDSLHQPLYYLEQWESEDALYAHLSSDLYRRVLAALELSKRAPEVRFYYAEKEKGFELIEAVRARANLERSLDETNQTNL